MRGTMSAGLRYLARSRRRTILTIIGIALSVALVCGTALIADAARDEGFRYARNRFGSQYAEVAGLSEAQVETLRSHAAVDRLGTSVYAGTQTLSESDSLLIQGYDAPALELSNLRLSSGRWPREVGEVAVERWALRPMGRPALGDTIDLAVAPLGAADQPATTLRYLLCGIVENREWSQQAHSGLAVTTIAGALAALPGAEPLYAASFTTRKGLAIQETLRQIATATGIPFVEMRQNNGLLTAMEESKSNRMNGAVLWLQAILTIVVLVSTVGVIYNSFAISVAERTREFGLLRAAGATPGQVRGVILAEAAILCAAGLPLGLLGGAGAVSLLFRIFATFSTAAFSDLRIVPAPQPLLIGAVVGGISVFLCALLPALAAGRTAPLAAISSGLGREARPPRRGLLTRLLGRHSVEAELAWLNMRRNRRRFAVTVFSMSIAVTLFVVFSFFLALMSLTMSNYAWNRLQQDLAVYPVPFAPEAELTAAELLEVQSLPYVADVRTTRYAYSSIQLPASALEPKFRGYLETGKTPGGSIAADGGATLAVDLFGLGERELELSRSGIIHGNPSTAAMRSGVLVWPACFVMGATPKALRLHPGDEITIRCADGTTLSAPVVGLLDQPPSARNLRSYVPALVLGEELFARIAGARGYASLEIGLRDGTDREEAIDGIEAATSGAKGRQVVDEQASYRMLRDTQTQISVLFYGLVVVVSLIGAISIINTVSTNLILRTREFGTIRATGMALGQLRLMVVLEGIFTSLVAALLGGLAGTGIARALFTQVKSFQEVPWLVPWPNIAIAAVAALGIGAVSSLIPFRRIASLSVVEAIRGTE